MQRRKPKLKIFIISTLASVVIVAGLLVGAVRLIDVALPEYRDQLAARIGDRIDRRVDIGAMDLRWDWYGPVLQLKQAQIFDSEAAPGDEQSAISLESLALHFNLWDLLHAKFQPQGISLTGAKISAYRDLDGKLRLRGLAAGEDKMDWRQAVQRLNEFSFLRINNSQILWRPKLEKPRQYHLRDVNLSLENDGSNHRVQGKLTLPAELGESLKIEALITDQNNQTDKTITLNQLRANADVQGKALDFVAMAQAAGMVFEPTNVGRNDLEINGHWQAGQFVGAHVSVAGLATADGRQQGRLLPAQAALDFDISPLETGYVATLDTLSTPTGLAPQVGGEVLIKPNGKTLTARLQNLPAGLLGGWLTLLDNNSAWNTSGTLPQVQLSYNGQAQPSEFSGEVSFTDLDLANPERGLNVVGLSGQTKLGRDGGQLLLQIADGSFTWPDYIQGEFPLDTLTGQLNWDRSANGWGLQAKQLRWRGADTEVTGEGEITLPANGAAEADIKAQVQSQDLPRLFAYLPQNPDLPNRRLRDWLPKAVLTGKMPQAKVTLQGPLDRFPFAQGGGKFEVTAIVEQASLDYKPGWPKLTQGRGKLTLIGDTLTVDAEHGQMLGVDLGPASARVADVREPILKISGQVENTDANKLLNFLPNSPLNEKFGRLAQLLEVSGTASLALDLSIPLKPELGDVRSDGRITLKNTRLSHRVLPEPIENINGVLEFTRKGLSAQGLKATLMSLPLQADLTPAESGGLDINASTLVRMPRDFDALRRFMPAAVVHQIGGEGVWHAGLEVSPDGQVSDLALHSDLQGISLGFPSPLSKKSAGPLPIRVSVGGDRERIHVDLADRLDLTIRSPEGQVSGMDFIFGDTGESAPTGDGIWLGGRIATLDLLAWQTFLAAFGDSDKQADKASKRNKSKLNLRGADLRIAETHVGGQRIAAMQFGLAPLADSRGWSAHVEGPGALGDLRYLPAPTGTQGARALLDAHFERIEFTPNSNKISSQANPPDETIEESDQRDPANLPVTDVVIDKIRLDGLDIGHLNLQAHAIANGIELSQLQIAGGKLKLDAQGQWLRQNEITQAQLQANVKGAGLGGLLRTLGYAANIRAKDTDIQTKLEIAPNPNGLDPGALNGTMKVKFDDGTLVSVDPGAGRVLGLLNFYALPRRLLLDFRDVVNEGLAFDNIRGDFQINSGVARSGNLRIKTPSATVRVTGTVDLAERTYDQRVTIVPEVSSGVAVAGTVLGGPAVGAFLLLAQKILEAPIANLSTIKYHLTGNWQDPEINTITTQDKPQDEQEQTQ